MVVRLDVHTKSDDGEICLHCFQNWPCNTVQVANAAYESAAVEMEAWGETMPVYLAPKSGLLISRRAVATAASEKIRALIKN